MRIPPDAAVPPGPAERGWLMDDRIDFAHLALTIALMVLILTLFALALWGYGSLVERG